MFWNSLKKIEFKLTWLKL